MANQDYLPTASLDRLRQRAKLLRRIRDFFDDQGFMEVETPILSHDTCVDRHLHPILVNKEATFSGQGTCSTNQPPLFLQTSPEFGMKRLLAAGATAIYQMTKVFRGGEMGSRHNPEFTMLEWYRVGDDLHCGMDFLTQFIHEILRRPPVVKLSYQELFQKHVGVNPFRGKVPELKQVCSDSNIVLDQQSETMEERDFWLNLILSEIIEPAIGFDHPVLVYDWPPTQSALAIVRPGAQPVAERFELFVDGLEIANGYHELLDAHELRRRNRIQNQWRSADGHTPLPEHSRLLDAMEAGLPACAGVALGIDRLAMLVTETKQIEDVIAFPFDRA